MRSSFSGAVQQVHSDAVYAIFFYSFPVTPLAAPSSETKLHPSGLAVLPESDPIDDHATRVEEVMYLKKLTILSGVAICIVGSADAAILDIVVNYTGDAQYQPLFASAEATWESYITGYQNGFVTATTAGSSYTGGETVSQLYIDASITAIDGPGMILGSAGPTELALDSSSFYLATDGAMQFDSADVAGLGSSLEDVILHEMGHVLGFGTLWELNGVYNEAGNPGEYTGSNATAYWQSEFGQSGTPDVELGGGSGTAHGHWNEVDGGVSATSITDSLGRDMQNELMTGWLNSNPFISDMTLASLEDIGFTVDYAANNVAVPEPSSTTLLGFGSLVALIGYRRRQPRAAIAVD